MNDYSMMDDKSMEISEYIMGTRNGIPEGEKIGHAWFQRLMGRMVIIYGSPETGGTYAADQSGYLFTRAEVLDLLAEMTPFFDRFSDDEIDKFNSQLSDAREEIARQPNPTAEKKRKVLAGWVYVVEGENGLYKIGQTTRTPDKRLEEFTPKLPFRSKLLFSIKADDVYQLEADLHAHFAQQRIHGEWFRLSTSDLNSLRELAG